MTKIQFAGMVAMSIMTLAVVLILGHNKIDCEAPSTWATASGVQHCAVNGGK